MGVSSVCGGCRGKASISNGIGGCEDCVGVNSVYGGCKGRVLSMVFVDAGGK